MQTLTNPRHETFALNLAQGASPESAYRAAGFSDNNRKTRARELAQDPDIAARVAHLQYCLPHINDLRDRFAPSLLLMPETKEQMIAWLWQVMNGSRKILPLQLRAATLFCRLNGWHLKPKEALATETAHTASQVELQRRADPTPLHDQARDLERHLLANLSRETIASDLAHRPVAQAATAPFYSTMADLALPESSSVGSQLIPAPEAAALAALPASIPTAPQLHAAATPSHDQTPGVPACSPRPDALPSRRPSLPPSPAPVQDGPSPNGDKNHIAAPQPPLPSAAAAVSQTRAA